LIQPMSSGASSSAIATCSSWERISASVIGRRTAAPAA
jgi:hypothetical protein